LQALSSRGCACGLARTAPTERRTNGPIDEVRSHVGPPRDDSHHPVRETPWSSDLGFVVFLAFLPRLVNDAPQFDCDQSLDCLPSFRSEGAYVVVEIIRNLEVQSRHGARDYDAVASQFGLLTSLTLDAKRSLS
jgi:hypothetical protein